MKFSTIKRQVNGFTIWLTGYSGAGKTTLSREIYRYLMELGIPCEILDGDAVREHLSSGLGFSKKDRCTNIRRIGYVAELLSRNGVCTIVSAISPYRAAREEVRSRITRFVEVFVNCSIEECERRDIKGLYKKARCGELSNFTGISDPYEEPLCAEVVCYTETENLDESMSKIINYLHASQLLPAFQASQTQK